MKKEKFSPREELLAFQKKIFARNDAIIKEQTHISEREFGAYEGRYKRRVSSFKKVVSPEEVFNAIERADIIYLGDYHTNPQSQRTLLRILKRLIPGRQTVGVALELIQKRHQDLLAAFIEGKIEEVDFVSQIHLEKYWYFDLWENFKPVFDFARFHKMPIFGIETYTHVQTNLKKRDVSMAREIVRLIKSYPAMKLIVFVGDLHIAPQHLPNEVEKLSKKSGLKPKRLILYQNSEKIYWRLAGKGLEEKVEAVKIDKGSFCFNNTPPIIWQQSFLNWLDAEGGEIDWTDAKHQFLELTHRIADFLGLPLPGDVDEVEVYTTGYLNFLGRLKRDPQISQKEWRFIRRQVLSSESYFLPKRRIVYLGNVSMNHVAEEAAHYLKHLCSGLEFPRRLIDAFYANILHEAVGFFGSKIVNQKRKCMTAALYASHIKYLRSVKEKTPDQVRDLAISKLVIEHKRLESQGRMMTPQRVAGLPQEVFWGATHGLGYILGDQLYYAMLEERISKEEIKELFCETMEEEGETIEHYRKLLAKMRGVKIPKRI